MQPETPPTRPPRLLTIAGSDSGGGAGIQADLKTFAAHGVYGMSAVTAVTAQNTRAVTAVHPIPPDVVAAQIDAVFDDLGVDGVKIGMLAGAPIVRAVAATLRRWIERLGDAAPPVVLDPVMVAKSGDALLADDAVEALSAELLPLATVVTPNLPEAACLTGLPVASGPEREAAVQALARGTGAERGGGAALLKGGHGEGAEVVDLLVDLRGARTEAGEVAVQAFRHPRIASRSTHGTGCTLSSAIAARLAAGAPLAEAIGGAIDYLQAAMAHAYPLGGGHGPVDHLVGLHRTEARSA